MVVFCANDATMGAVQQTISATTPASLDRLFEVMSDLGTFSNWMSLIEKCEVAVPSPDDVGPAWWITLRAKVGPFARSKRLRMVRTQMDPDSYVRFERRETDGKSHSDWIMEAKLVALDSPADGNISSVTVDLSYSGGLWSGPLEAVLGSQVTDAVPRLRAYVSV
jgi:hypothetical protein